MNNLNHILIIYGLINLIAFIIMGVDKLKAKRGSYRISEATILLFAVILGAVGVSCGMIGFHHKVSKMKFRLLIPIFMLINIVEIYFIMKFYGGILL